MKKNKKPKGVQGTLHKVSGPLNGDDRLHDDEQHERKYMTLSLRIVLSAGLVGVFLFCAFGFLATFEPGDQAAMMTFRLIYGIAGVASISGLVALWHKKSRHND